MANVLIKIAECQELGRVRACAGNLYLKSQSAHAKDSQVQASKDASLHDAEDNSDPGDDIHGVQWEHHSLRVFDGRLFT